MGEWTIPHPSYLFGMRHVRFPEAGRSKTRIQNVGPRDTEIADSASMAKTVKMKELDLPPPMFSPMSHWRPRDSVDKPQI